MLNIVDIPISKVISPAWNANTLDESMESKLAASIVRFGFVLPLVAREVEGGRYETIGGAQRLAALCALGYKTVPCVVVHAADAEARLLAQALNRIHGEDDLGLRAESLRFILETHSQQEVLEILPETSDSLADMATLGAGDLAAHLQAWQRAQSARLKHLTIQLLPSQLNKVEEALSLALEEADGTDNPNKRGSALFSLCCQYLELRKGKVG